MSSVRANRKNIKTDKAGDNIVSRMLIVFVICIGLPIFLLMNKGGPIERAIVVGSQPWLTIAAAVLFIAALVWYIVRLPKKEEESGKIFSSSAILIAAAVLLAVSVSYRFLGTYLVCGFLLTVMMLSLTYHFYPASAVWLTVFASVGAALVIAARSPLSGGLFTVIAIIGKILAFVWPVCGALIALSVKKKGGSLKNGLRVFENDESALPFVIVGAVCVVGAAVACLFSSFAPWCAAAVVAVYIVFFVIVSVKKVK